MISAEYGFHNENDYSESDREMKDEKTAVDEKLLYMGARNIYRELIRFYNILTY